jgi:alpha-mannosidase
VIHKNHIQKTLGKLRKLEEVYESLIYYKADEVQVNYFETVEHLYTVPGEEADWLPAGKDLVWGRPWGSAWFNGSYQIPQSLHGRKLFIQAKTDGVETFFWVDGRPKGIFTHPKDAANRGNHRTLLLAEQARAGDVYELAFEGYAGHPCVGTQPYQSYESGDGSPIRYERVFRSIDVVLCREDVQDFVFNLRTLNQIVRSGAVDDFRKGKISNALLEAFRYLTQSPDEEPEEVWRSGMEAAAKAIKPLLEPKNGPSGPRAGLIGHSHMDTAWLWTRDETIRKCARTYANALSLMEQYPEYTFVQSSAFHVELMRRHYPDIFEGIKRRVAEGRWEPNGGVWIESDCNLVNGESLVRQFLKGQRYTREHFGYTSDTFWLPDTFGYSAAIPQIMAGTGIRYFLTTKLSWNDTNVFPYDTFVWQGMDGTRVLTHFNTIHCWPDAETVLNRVYESGKNGIQHRQVNDRRLVSYGYGDGGGGPQHEMLEMSRRIRDTEGVPRSEHTTVSRFMQELEETSIHPPVHAGELYFEGHRGTLTQMHQIKRNNRKAEFALRNLELAEVLHWSSGAGRPSARTAELYELLLINQFHDILPGTSIPEVHDRAIHEVNSIISEAGRMADDLLAAAVMPDPNRITALNTLGWDRHGTIALDVEDESVHSADPSLPSQRIEDVFGRRKLLIGGVTMPALGIAAIAVAPRAEETAASPFRYDGERVETPFAHVVFDENGYIASFVDKATGRELRGSGYPLNAFLLGEDLPGAWDNWDIDRDQSGKLRLQTALESRELAADGPLQLRIRSVYRIGKSSYLKQDIVFHSDSPRVDFETAINWKEKHRLLKVGFDVNILAPQARHEIQFGYVERPTHDNTPFDQGMFEVCNHKWTDLSENRFGVALLNDCKYGISISGSDMRLSLHKGGTHPDPRGDEGFHEAVYALLPHEGGFGAETVIRPAYELNVPPLAVSGRLARNGDSLVTIDASNVIVETVKPAEEGEAYVLRLFEAERSAVKGAKLRFGKLPSRVALTDMLEEELQEISLDGVEISLDFRAFEIKTVKVYL